MAKEKLFEIKPELKKYFREELREQKLTIYDWNNDYYMILEALQEVKEGKTKLITGRELKEGKKYTHIKSGNIYIITLVSLDKKIKIDGYWHTGVVEYKGQLLNGFVRAYSDFIEKFEEVKEERVELFVASYDGAEMGLFKTTEIDWTKEEVKQHTAFYNASEETKQAVLKAYQKEKK